MSRLQVKTPSQADAAVEQLYRNMEQRIAASPPGLCPVDLALNFLNLCRAQTCGKCVPCRIGLTQLANMLQEVLEGEPDPHILHHIEVTAEVIVNTADCAIGIDAANMVLVGLKGFREDYEEHILHHRCLGYLRHPVPCVALCPAGVDIPGYIALVKEGRSADAVRLIRKDNPFPTACAYICEHPCEARCRRNMVDDALNIRALKRYAVDQAGDVPQPDCASATGKKVAVIGGGPGGLSAAYYLALMGHKVTVYEKRERLGGMMRYGIPSYRLPREKLDQDIQSILSLGIEVHTGVSSAVELLRHIGDDEMPDFTGLEVAVIGGGNVAMDVTRSAIRLGARKVSCVYRRRLEDMTAQMEEVEGAMAEGAEILALHAPTRIESGENGEVKALWVQPQVIGEVDQGSGRPKPYAADVGERRIPADVIIVAVGQGIESAGLEQSGIHIQRGGRLMANPTTQLSEMEGVFAGGDCVTGPATVIRAIAAGKVAAANIDEYLGFHHEITAQVKVPAPRFNDLRPTGRVSNAERDADERKRDFLCIECGLSNEEARQESGRCLRCDHFGYGNFKGGREEKW